MNRNKIIFVACFVFTMCSVFESAWSAQNTKAKVASPSAAAVQRPRVIYFYTTWCPTCQAYGPILKKTVAAYKNYIDFQSFNVGDQHNGAICNRFGIHQIPATFIYNSDGHCVFTKVGAGDQQTIYSALRSVYMDMVSKQSQQANKQNKK